MRFDHGSDMIKVQNKRDIVFALTDVSISRIFLAGKIFMKISQKIRWVFSLVLLSKDDFLRKNDRLIVSYTKNIRLFPAMGEDDVCGGYDNLVVIGTVRKNGLTPIFSAVSRALKSPRFLSRSFTLMLSKGAFIAV